MHLGSKIEGLWFRVWEDLGEDVAGGVPGVDDDQRLREGALRACGRDLLKGASNVRAGET